MSLEEQQCIKEIHLKQIKTNLPGTVASRVIFTEIPREVAASVPSNLLSSQPQDKQSITFIVGRSLACPIHDTPSLSSMSIRRILGSVAAYLAVEIKRARPLPISVCWYCNQSTFHQKRPLSERSQAFTQNSALSRLGGR